MAKETDVSTRVLTPAEQAEDALVERVGRVVGYVPVGFRDLLHVLSHPDVIANTQAYLDSKRVPAPTPSDGDDES